MLRPMHSSREDLTDASNAHGAGGIDASHFVPTPLNTPFSTNAQQPGQPNPQAMASALKQQQQHNPSLQNPASSLTANTSINNPLLQSKLVQQLGKEAQVRYSINNRT